MTLTLLLLTVPLLLAAILTGFGLERRDTDAPVRGRHSRAPGKHAARNGRTGSRPGAGPRSAVDSRPTGGP